MPSEGRRPPAGRRALLAAAQGEQFSLKVNKLMSVKNLPYEFYSLPYCQPDKVISSAENLGEVLRGDRIDNSLYSVRRRRGGPGPLKDFSNTFGRRPTGRPAKRGKRGRQRRGAARLAPALAVPRAAAGGAGSCGWQARG